MVGRPPGPRAQQPASRTFRNLIEQWIHCPPARPGSLEANQPPNIAQLEVPVAPPSITYPKKGSSVVL